MLALPCVLIKKLLTPHLKVTDKSATLPSLLHGMFHALETSERFTCERKVFEYEYISIYAETRKMHAETRKMRSISVGYLRFIAEV